MSRSNKPRGYRSHSYLRSGTTFLKWYRVTNNRRVRHQTKERLADIMFNDAYDEKKLNLKPQEHWNRWLAF